MGHNAAVSAAQALRLLSSPELRHHPARGPQPRRGTPTTPAAPMDLGLLDYLTAHVDEVVTHTRETAGPVPAPRAGEDLYDWYIAHTGDADADQQVFRDTVIERHALEHAVRLGDVHQVCRHPCPGCGRWGLMWDHGGNRARCTHRKCRTPDGMASTWTLARLAAQKVQGTEIWRRNAT